mmetsp:Transcript_13195/g.28567  ORF Transcript_13195/g.28567 Transcript_13195/m.28567 type:complete len:283 (-) Transcript_13195:11-859(-)
MQQDGGWIVQRHTPLVADRLVSALIEACDLPDKWTCWVREAPHFAQEVWRQPGWSCDVQGCDLRIETGGEHARSCLRVVGDVRLGHWAYVSRLDHCATHEVKIRTELRQLGLQAQGQGHVRERRQRHQQRSRMPAAASMCDELRRAQRGVDACPGGGQLDASKPIRAMELRSTEVMEGLGQRVRRPKKDRDVLAAGKRQDVQGVLCQLRGIVKRAEIYTHRPDVELWRCQGQEQRNGVVDSWVGADDNRAPLRHCGAKCGGRCQRGECCAEHGFSRDLRSKE